MDFSHPTRRRLSEPALPMINVVFLLLIFFLMSATIVTPPPVEVTPPAAAVGDATAAELRLHVAADGTLGFGATKGAAALAGLAAVTDRDSAVLLIRADAALPADELARVLAQVSALGFGRVQIAAVKR